jgi:imidazolonepropionase-like amidohydrolase
MRKAKRVKKVIVGASVVFVCLAVAVVAIGIALAPPPPLAVVSLTFELPDVTVVNPASERLEHRNVRVASGRIERIGNDAPASAALAEYRGMYVLPGLIDMHAHLPPKTPLQLTSYFTLLNLAYGVTTIRNAGDIDGTALPAARDAEARGYPAPRMRYCDAFVSAGPSRWANTIVLQSPDDADAAVASLEARGASCVKAYDGLTLPMLRALETAANKYGLALLGHVPHALRYEEALLPDVQHLMGIAALDPNRHFHLSDGWDAVDDARLDAIVATTRAHDLANTPTLVLGQQVLLLEHYAQSQNDPAARLLPRLFREVVWNPVSGLPVYRGLTSADFGKLHIAQEKKLRLVRRLYDAGTKLYLGTDVQQPFVAPGYALQQEMRLFVAAGIPPEQVWDMATRQSGRALNIPQLGELSAGAPADLLIFRADPTRDLAALDSLAAVVSQGRLYPRAALDAKLAEYHAHHESFVFDRLSIVLARLALRRTAAAE